jgi:hypothetical protein
VDDKDASLFPIAIPNPSGKLELAMLHRPLFPGTRPEETVRRSASGEVDLESGKHLDFLLSDGRGRQWSISSRPVCLAPPAGDSGVTARSGSKSAVALHLS